MTFIGDRSYSLYLVQGVAGVVAASVVPAFGSGSTATAVAVAVTGLFMADARYRGVELPFIAVGRRWVAWRTRTAPSGPAARRRDLTAASAVSGPPRVASGRQ